MKLRTPIWLSLKTVSAFSSAYGRKEEKNQEGSSAVCKAADLCEGYCCCCHCCCSGAINKVPSYFLGHSKHLKFEVSSSCKFAYMNYIYTIRKIWNYLKILLNISKVKFLFNMQIFNNALVLLNVWTFLFYWELLWTGKVDETVRILNTLHRINVRKYNYN